ncbi:WecB/TagA/CpsF family glycosyltransferase [Glycomyces sp. YM15]|uniref:WecB/TagA/CpsF family glycosyltransferase n=1 Tax=Glycomyces sp. YM15 TaxID=2800446 RepID=UPI00196517B2|nr:WecB/TagA/CpsF family glycosyltransferase [Glycomyces sp. YM15]
MSDPRIRRVDVLGVGVSTVNQEMALAEVTRWVDTGERHYVCVTGVHGVMESQRDPELLAIHNASGLTTPDGMPMVWAGHKAGADWMDRVYGPDLMLNVLARAAERGWTSFLYGGKDGVPELLAEKLAERLPGVKFAGMYSPPFRPLTEEEDAGIVKRINDSGAQLVWVGLSTPKQERWMAAHRDRLNAPAMFGVGAAFDFHAGLVPQAPPWMQRNGLEWFYRLTKEPKRLWRRYFRNNPAYLRAIRKRPPFLRD